MSDKKVWLVTGAGRGLGVDIAKAALAAGHAVVATGRNPERVRAAIGEHLDLLAVKLDALIPPTQRRLWRLPSTGWAGSTCWSTTRATQRRLLRGAKS